MSGTQIFVALVLSPGHDLSLSGSSGDVVGEFLVPAGVLRTECQPLGSERAVHAVGNRVHSREISSYRGAYRLPGTAKHLTTQFLGSRSGF